MRHVRVTVPAPEAELVADLAWCSGAAGIEERPSGTPGDRVDLVVSVEDPAAFRHGLAGRWPVVEEHRDPDEWVESWKPYAEAVDLGALVVAPPWVEVPSGRRVVRIDPGRAWGHGAHPTSRLVLDALVRRPPVGAPVLDVGCGSGVLSVVALVLGAERAMAFDVDPAALEATRENAERAGVADRLDVRSVGGSARWGWPEGDAPPGGVVVANVDAPVLEAHAADLAAIVPPGGRLLLSGMLDERASGIEAAVLASATAAGRPLVVGERTSLDGWTALDLRSAHRRSVA